MTTLHEIDFTAWLESQMDCIRRRDFDHLDITNLLEEMEDLGGSIKSSIASHLTNIMLHMLKSEYQSSMRCNSWNASIANSRAAIERHVDENPSLRKYPAQALDDSYKYAIRGASKESGISEKIFPSQCPWTLNEILGE